MKRIRLGGSVSLGALLMLVLGATALMAGDSPYFSSEANVTRAQQILVNDGYLEQGSFDTGSLDAATRDALKQYQSDHAMNDRGFLDEETFQNLTSHETSYPWGEEPSTVANAAEPAEEVEVAEAPAVPEPAAAPEEEKEVVVAQAEPEEAAPAKEAAPAMPATGSNLPLLALSGLALLGTGALLLKRSS